MTGLAFIDCETTGLDYERHEVWEVACVVRGHDDPIRDGEHHWFLPLARRDDADKRALEVGGFYDRYPPRRRVDQLTSFGPFARQFVLLTEGCVWIGCNPMFDIRFIEPIIHRAGATPAWHYRPVCAESLAAGALGVDVPVPWSNRKDLAPRLGIELADEHTALGDALYAERLYWAVMS